jgi:hypothetical protein
VTDGGNNLMEISMYRTDLDFNRPYNKSVTDEDRNRQKTPGYTEGIHVTDGNYINMPHY